MGGGVNKATARFYFGVLFFLLFGDARRLAFVCRRSASCFFFFLSPPPPFNVVVVPVVVDSLCFCSRSDLQTL